MREHPVVRLMKAGASPIFWSLTAIAMQNVLQLQNLLYVYMFLHNRPCKNVCVFNGAKVAAESAHDRFQPPRS